MTVISGLLILQLAAVVVQGKLPGSVFRITPQPGQILFVLQFQLGRLFPSTAQIGLRVFTERKGVDNYNIFGPRITRNKPNPPVYIQKPSNVAGSTELAATSEARPPASPGKKTPPQNTHSGVEKLKTPYTWGTVQDLIYKQHFLTRVRNIHKWGRSNESAVLLILLSWFTIFILAQTRILRVDTWGFWSPDLEEHQNHYSSTGSHWKSDLTPVVDLLFSKNFSQTILDAKIIYHLEHIGERQGRLHDKVQRQLDGNAIVLDFMLKEIRNLKSAFSAVMDKRQMERQIDRLKDDIKQCNKDMLSRTIRKPIIIKQRPTYTVTKMTRTVIWQHYRTPSPRTTVSTKVIFYPNEPIKPQKANQLVGLGATQMLTDKDVDRIAQKLAKSLGIPYKDSGPNDPWWSIFPSFPRAGKGTEKAFTKQFESIIQLLCPDDPGLLKSSFASRIQSCIKRRQAAASIFQSRTQSTVSNRVLSTAVKFSGDLPPVGASIISGAFILAYGTALARRISGRHRTDRRRGVLRIFTIFISALNVIIWPARLATVWTQLQEQFEPVRRLPLSTRVLTAVRGYILAAPEGRLAWLLYNPQTWQRPYDLARRFRLGLGIRVDYGSSSYSFFEKVENFCCSSFIWGMKNITWIGIPYVVIKCSALLVIFTFITRGIPAIRIGVARIRYRISWVEGGIPIAIGGVLDFWRKNRAFFTKEWATGLPQLLHILLKQLIISIRKKILRSFQQAKEVAQRRVYKAGGTSVPFLKLFENNYIAPARLLEAARFYASKIWGTTQSLLSTIWKYFQGAVLGFLRAVRGSCRCISRWASFMVWTVRESGAQVSERIRGLIAFAARDAKIAIPTPGPSGF
ncbi:hypothetical protein TWF718_000866 [Orbilia javanica]|uniref:Uncharacterized protein n=1 Tax=Orbilia javanica TaxID=47235 RepID=A0AAN8N0C1_9PEZI